MGAAINRKRWNLSLFPLFFSLSLSQGHHSLRVEVLNSTENVTVCSFESVSYFIRRHLHLSFSYIITPTSRTYFTLSLSPTLSLCLCLFLSVSVSLCLCLSLSLFFPLSVSLFLSSSMLVCQRVLVIPAWLTLIPPIVTAFLAIAFRLVAVSARDKEPLLFD